MVWAIVIGIALGLMVGLIITDGFNPFDPPYSF